MTSDTIRHYTSRLDKFAHWMNEYENMRKAGEDVEIQMCHLKADIEYVCDMLASEYSSDAICPIRVGQGHERNFVPHKERDDADYDELTEADRLEVEEILKRRRAANHYKTVSDLREEDEKEKDMLSGMHRCPECGKYMEMSNVKEHVPDNCSYGHDMKRVVVGRLYKCSRCGTEEYEKIGRWL